MAINAKQKKDNNFIEKVTKLDCEYCEKKIEYEKSVQEITQLKIEDAKLIPLKFLKPICAYKKRKGDKAIPTKRGELVERYISTKSHSDMNLEEWLCTKTTLFSRYKRDNGNNLTIDVIHQIIDKFNSKEKLVFDDVEKCSL